MTALLVGAVIYTGCVTQSKVDSWNQKHPDAEAKNCAVKYPCILPPADTIFTPGDSTQFKISLEALMLQLDSIRLQNDSLASVLHIDSNCRKFEAAVHSLQLRNAALQKLVNEFNCPSSTITITVPIKDSAETHAMRLQLQRTQEQLQQTQSTLTSTKSVCKVRFWMLIASWLLIVLIVYILFKIKSFSLPWKS
jgi:hypothetical protein